MGHYDLTVSMGIPAQFDHPRFLDSMDRLVAVSRKHGVAAGFMVTDARDAIRWIDHGFRAISLGSDVMTIMRTVRNERQAVLEHLTARPAAQGVSS
jgi:2-dehydro-3-deoxyglucarate aldolase/4-hydroxy-2-oxoheptanedioate aldolase